MKSKLSQFFSWTKLYSRNQYNLLAIFIFLFLDASLFPLPTTVAFITISLFQPKQSYYHALAAVAGMVAGAITGYFIGHYLWLVPDGGFTNFARFFFDHVPGVTESSYMIAQKLFFRWSYSILFFTMVIPIPYLFFTITAGAFSLNIFILIFATFIFQGFRFMLLGWLIHKYGEGARSILRRNMKTIILIVVTIGLLIYLFTRFGTTFFTER